MQPVYSNVQQDKIPTIQSKPPNKKDELINDSSFSTLFSSQLENIQNTFHSAVVSKNSPLGLQTPFEDEFSEEIIDDTLKVQLEAIKEWVANKDLLNLVIAGNKNQCSDAIFSHLSKNHHVGISNLEKDSVDIVLAPHSLCSQMDSVFQATEKLLKNDGSFSVYEHPFYPYFSSLKEDGLFVTTLKSGPDISSFTNILLGKHPFCDETSYSNSKFDVNLFNNAETFLRCLDIFKESFEVAVGKTIHVDISFSMSHQPLDAFCRRYINQYPELAELNLQESQKFIRLLSAFTVEEDIVDMNITLKMSVKPFLKEKHSFTPINQTHMDVQKGSNEISQGQQDLKLQIQNLNGSDVAMRYIKDADGQAQFDALQPVLGRKNLKIVDIGGGRGETNAVMNALHKAGSTIQLLNIEPEASFKDPYIQAHQSLGIDDVSVLPLKVQQLSEHDVADHFSDKVDVVFASHAFYFIIGDMFKASLNPNMPLDHHPMWKFFAMLKNDGVLLVTMQDGAGARLIRNAISGNHGLNPPSQSTDDETVSLLNSFGNIATFLKHFEVFSKHFNQETGKTIHVKMNYSMANVPLGGFKVTKNPMTSEYQLENLFNEKNDPSWVAPKMLNFYGNWKELQEAAICGEEAKENSARKSLEVFFKILPAFAIGVEHGSASKAVCMKHPNITLQFTMS